MNATVALLEIARERTPTGDFRQGETEELSYAARTFDLMIGFTSFQFAVDPVNALRQARRFARKGSPVVIATWGKPEEAGSAQYKAALSALSPLPPCTRPFCTFPSWCVRSRRE